MQVTITARHNDIPEDLRAKAADVVERLGRLANRPTSAHVTFDTEHQRATAEVVLNAARGAVHVAAAEADDHRTALDRVAAKLRRQLDKPPVRPARRAGKATAR